MYDLESDRAFECTAMPQLCFAAPTLPLELATLDNGTAYRLEIGRPAMFCAEVLELNDEGNVLRAEPSSGVKLYLEKSPSLCYGRE